MRKYFLLLALCCLAAAAEAKTVYETDLVSTAPPACPPGTALVNTGTIWSCTDQVADPCPQGQFMRLKEGAIVCAEAAAPEACLPGKVVTGVEDGGDPVCAAPVFKTSCREVEVKGAAPRYVSKAACGNDEFLASGRSLCAKGSLLRFNMPENNGWTVLCQTPEGDNAASAAVAVCCRF